MQFMNIVFLDFVITKQVVINLSKEFNPFIASIPNYFKTSEYVGISNC